MRAASCRGTIAEMSTRKKEIQFSSRTRAGTDSFKHAQRLRRAVAAQFCQAPARRGRPGRLLERQRISIVCVRRQEQARCRAHYRRRTNTSFTLTATCATASARVSQTANLRMLATDTRAYNSEYGVSGAIQVVVRGGSQSVRLTSDSGWAVFSLSR